jgi:hypothetical protein
MAFKKKPGYPLLFGGEREVVFLKPGKTGICSLPSTLGRGRA